MITLLKNFTVALSPSDTFRTEWVHFPAGHKNATLHLNMQSLSPVTPATGLSFTVETSFDTVESPEAGLGISVTAKGSNAEEISADLAPMARLKIENPDTVAIFGVVSVWLLPKSD